MKAAKDCYECLQRLAYQAAELASEAEAIRSRAVQEGLRVLEGSFSQDAVSIAVATKIHDVIKMITQNPDPYRQVKDREIQLARELCHEIKLEHGKDFGGYLKVAALGNTIDFFRPIEVIKKNIQEMRGRLVFAIDDSDKFEGKLRSAGNILYLADNAGEIFFDLPLIRFMRRYAPVTCVVKAAPVQNDVTLEDIGRAGLESEIGKVITTGTATPGIDFSLASAQFKQAFAAADLVFAKGMGYYESLSELPAAGKVFYCLMAKCQPVADSIGVPINSYVAILR